MKKYSFFLLLPLLSLMLACQQNKEQHVEIETEFGKMKIVLYNSTPKHRDNFIKLTKEGYYDGLLFHRIINGFMVQGGDPDSRNASPDAHLGMGGPSYLIDPEIGAPHVKGALAAARTNNPEKKSSGSQFYIVQGTPQVDEALDNMEKMKNIKYNPTQRAIYKEKGGTPMLDGDYTVFGEVIEGLEVVDKLGSVPTKPGDRPMQDVKMKIKLVD